MGGTPIPASPSENIDIGGGLIVLYYYFIQDGDDVNAYGEILNTEDVPHRAPSISFTFLDAVGNAYLTGEASPTRRWIGPGESLGFQGFVIQKTLRLGDWAAVSVNRGWMPSGDITAYDVSALSITEVDASGIVEDGAVVAGKLENSTGVSISIDEINIEYRDATGRFVGSCSEWLDASVPPGQFVRFSIELYEKGLCGFQIPVIALGVEEPLQYQIVPSRL